MYSVTKHARQRWEQRVNSEAGLDAEEQIREAFEKADYIADDPEDPDKGFYINADHLLFCVNTKKEVVITVVEVDFGFDKELNRTVANSLLKKIRKAQSELQRETDRNEDSGLKLKTAKEQLEREIEIKEAELRKIEAAEKNAQAELTIKKKECESLVNQLVYSVAFRKDQLVMKNQKEVA